MRYIVKVVKNDQIINIYSTNDYSSAIEIEHEAIKIYDDAWICDVLNEIMCG
jgi:hypothetical protein